MKRREFFVKSLALAGAICAPAFTQRFSPGTIVHVPAEMTYRKIKITCRKINSGDDVERLKLLHRGHLRDCLDAHRVGYFDRTIRLKLGTWSHT